jgi:hypothetical protein
MNCQASVVSFQCTGSGAPGSLICGLNAGAPASSACCGQPVSPRKSLKLREGCSCRAVGSRGSAGQQAHRGLISATQPAAADLAAQAAVAWFELVW